MFTYRVIKQQRWGESEYHIYYNGVHHSTFTNVKALTVQNVVDTLNQAYSLGYSEGYVDGKERKDYNVVS